MIQIKTKEEISIMSHGGHILAGVLDKVLAAAKPGVSEIELDQLAEKLILEKGGEPGFKKVSGYKHTICISTNDVVVHGIPGSYKLKEGDVVGIDCGVYYKGFHTDMAETIKVKSEKLKVKNNDEIDKFLYSGKMAMEEAIQEAKIGKRVGHISKKLQEIVEGNGYSIVRNLVGHGVGRKLHEEPEIPGFLDGSIEKTSLLKANMTIAIEAIYAMGKRDVVYRGDDGWTIKTADGSLAGLFERTVLISQNGPMILTK